MRGHAADAVGFESQTFRRLLTGNGPLELHQLLSIAAQDPYPLESPVGTGNSTHRRQQQSLATGQIWPGRAATRARAVCI